MITEEAVLHIASRQDLMLEMLSSSMFLLRWAITLLVANFLLVSFVAVTQGYKVRIHRRVEHKIDTFLLWAKSYLDRQEPVYEAMISLAAQADSKTTNALTKIEKVVEKGITDAAKVVADQAAAGSADSGNKIPVVPSP